ncbi:unnamed protein product [Brassica oleracea var. botrytis]
MRFEIEEERGVSPLQILRMDANEIKKARTKWVLKPNKGNILAQTTCKLRLRAGSLFTIISNTDPISTTERLHLQNVSEIESSRQQIRRGCSFPTLPPLASDAGPSRCRV